MIKFEKIKAGMTLYDVRRAGLSSRLASRSNWDVWPVFIKDVDEVNRRVFASWNGNPPQWYSEKRITKFRASEPKEREAEAKARHDMEIKIGDTVQAWGSVGEVTDVHSGDAATPPCRKIYSVWFGEATFYVRDDEVQAVNRIPVIKEKPNA